MTKDSFNLGSQLGPIGSPETTLQRLGQSPTSSPFSTQLDLSHAALPGTVIDALVQGGMIANPHLDGDWSGMEWDPSKFIALATPAPIEAITTVNPELRNYVVLNYGGRVLSENSFEELERFISDKDLFSNNPDAWHVDKTAFEHDEFKLYEHSREIGASDVLSLAGLDGSKMAETTMLFEGMRSNLASLLKNNRHAFLGASDALTPSLIDNFIEAKTEDVQYVLDIIKKGFRLGRTENLDFYVPVFEAHPVTIAGSDSVAEQTIPVEFSTTSKETSAVQFKVEVPGLSGGFGHEGSIEIQREAAPSSEPIQLQSVMNARINIWFGRDGHEVRTYSFERTNGANFVGKSKERYIPVSTPIDGADFVDRGIQGNDTDVVVTNSFAIKHGCTETFGFKQNVLGSSVDFSVRTSNEAEVSLKHEQPPNYDYQYFSTTAKGHDIRVNAYKV